MTPRRGGLLAILALTLALPLPARAEAPEARALVRQIETQYQGRTSHARMIMKIVTRGYTREMAMETWSQGRDKFLARVLAPKKDAGTATLKLGTEMWNYLPKIDRMIKVPGSMMGDRWMGSHLTNDDLVKDQQVDELYRFSTTPGPGGSTLITAVPRPQTPVVWGKIVYQLDLAAKLPQRISYHDEDGVLARVMSFDEVKQLGDRRLPTRMRFAPTDEEGEYTEVRYETLEFDRPFPEDTFSLRSLRRAP